MKKRAMFWLGLGFWLGGGVLTVQADLTIWANNGEDKVTRDELRATVSPASVVNSVWDGTKVKVFGAKNEIVAFNLILEAGNTAVNNVSVSFNTLTGPNGYVISGRGVNQSDLDDDLFNYVGRNIELFYVRYLQIKGLSLSFYGAGWDERHFPISLQRPYTPQTGYVGTGTWYDRPNHDKYYPDIAVPLELHSTFTIAANNNQSIWSDIYIPKDAPAGTYTGMVTVSENGTSTRQVPVQLTVHNFSLPDLPYGKTMLVGGGMDGNTSPRYTPVQWPNPGDPNYILMQTVSQRHSQMAHRHKISLIREGDELTHTPQNTPQETIDALSGALFTAARGYDGPGVNTGINILSLGTYGSWRTYNWFNGLTTDDQQRQAMWTNTDAWVNWLNAQNFQTPTEAFVYLTDENPDYATTNKWARWMNENPGQGNQIMSFTTGLIPSMFANIPELDILSSPVTLNVLGTFKGIVSAMRNQGKKLHLYNGSRVEQGSFQTEDEGISLVVQGWAQFKKKIDRWFFFESTYYNDYQCGMGLTNVFQSARTFGTDDHLEETGLARGRTGWEYNNGAGVMFYPGTDLIFPEENYNIHGPIASLRLKFWRRGMQDVDYLTMAERINPVRVSEIVNEMIPHVLWEYGDDDNGDGNPDYYDRYDKRDPTWAAYDISWSTNPDVWEAARAELADIIENQGVGRVYVSGAVTYNGSGLQGVVLNGLPGNPVTNTSGQYTMTVPLGWSGTVIPIKAGYSFTPGQHVYSNVTTDQTGQNYTASTIPYTISGTITYKGGGLANVVLYDLPGSPITDASGQYAADVHSGFSSTVRPILAGYTFTPAFLRYPANQIVAQTGQDYIASVSSSGSGPSGEGGGGGGGCFIAGVAYGFGNVLPTSILRRIHDRFSTAKILAGDGSRARPFGRESFGFGQVWNLLDGLVVACLWFVASAFSFHGKRISIQNGSNQRLLKGLAIKHGDL